MNEQEFSTYPKVLRIGSPRAENTVKDIEGEIYIQEKLDGCNCRFQLKENGKIFFGSKTQYWELDIDNPDLEKIPPMFQKAVNRILTHTNWERLREKQQENDTIYTFYGENMVLHNFEYNWEQMKQVYFFDAYDEKMNEFLHPNKTTQLLDNIGHEERIVPHHTIGKKETIDLENFELPESHFRNGKPEGVVIKNPDTGIKKKIHHPDFKEVNSYSFGTMRGGTDEDRLVNDFCSNTRILKILQKEVAENNKELTMKDMMGDANVHHTVLHDIWEEEHKNIAHKQWELDLRKVKKMVTRRTKKVLKRRINIKKRNEVSDLEALSIRWD